MNFLSPASIAIAAALTVPPLIALYFLKLKRTAKSVSSTLLWKRAVEDLQVNAPFQRLRKSLLLLLQLMVLTLAALALGKPMWETMEAHEDTLILLIDQSASMAVVEEGGLNRLQLAREQAKRTIDSMGDNARAMIIAFCDRATVISSFDTDKSALRRKIDTIELTHAASSLSEAISMAEAHSQNLIIGGDSPGTDAVPPPVSTAPPATVFLFTDGRIEDADKVSFQKFEVGRMKVTNVARRGDNVGLIAMDASRNYEFPERLAVTATIQNFGPNPIEVDAVLYIDSVSVDVKSLSLEAAPADGIPVPAAGAESGRDLEDSLENSASDAASAARSTSNMNRNRKVAAFDEVDFGGGGVVEVLLRIDDALSTDDRAWTVIDAPRRTKVLLVTEGNIFLEGILGSLPIDLVRMTPAGYESADPATLLESDRSAFDVVMLDRHSTSKLPPGNYMFWGAAPKLSGVSMGESVARPIISNWDSSHPILRHVAVEAIDVYEWRTMKLPSDAVSLIDGINGPVLAYFAREGSQFLLSSFSLVVQDDQGRLLKNTDWAVTADFVVCIQNIIQYLSASVSAKGKKGLAPGEPVTLRLPPRTDVVRIHRPDAVVDTLSAGRFDTIHYAGTRTVGTYRMEPGVRGDEVFAVNLFNTTESNVAPASHITFGTESVRATAGALPVNQPAWPYFVLGILVLLMLEWIVYNRRVFV